MHLLETISPNRQMKAFKMELDLLPRACFILRFIHENNNSIFIVMSHLHNSSHGFI